MSSIVVAVNEILSNPLNSYRVIDDLIHCTHTHKTYNYLLQHNTIVHKPRAQSPLFLCCWRAQLQKPGVSVAYSEGWWDLCNSRPMQSATSH